MREQREHPFKSRRRHLFTRLLLVALLFRAYVPVGFMPASGTPFLLELCPATYQSPMPAHPGHHHSGTHTHFENCPFGSAPAAVISSAQRRLRTSAAGGKSPTRSSAPRSPHPRLN